MIRDLPADQPARAAWTPWLAQDARLTAADIRKRGDLLRHDDDALGAHVVAITGRVRSSVLN